MDGNKNNSNLIRTDTFLYKIKMFFVNLFSIHLVKKSSNSMQNNSCIQNSKNIENCEMQNNKEKFINQIRIKNNEENETQKLVRLLKTKSIYVEELTESQKGEIKLFLQKEIEEKRLKLQNIKNKKLYNKLKNINDIDLVLSNTPTEEKANFIEYLKEQINIKKNKLKIEV